MNKMRRHFGHAVIRTRTQPRSTEIIAPHLLDLSSDDTSGVCVVRASRGDPVNPRPTQEGSSRQSRTPSSRRDARWLSWSSNGLLGGKKVLVDLGQTCVEPLWLVALSRWFSYLQWWAWWRMCSLGETNTITLQPSHISGSSYFRMSWKCSDSR